MRFFSEGFKNGEWKRFLRFAGVGAINTGVSFLIYVVLVKSNLHYILSSIVAYIAGIAVSYLLNTFFVFQEKRTASNLFKFVSVYLTALLINLTLLYLAVDIIGISKIMGQIAVTALVLFYNYFLQKIWTFRKKTEGNR